jgi:hypothetical protein
MKKFLLIFTIIIIIFINIYNLYSDDFNFHLINSPLGSQYDLGVVKTLIGYNLLVTQNLSYYYKIYYSTNNGVSWEIHDTFAIVSKKPAFALYKNNILYAAPLGTRLGPDHFPTGGLLKTIDNGENWITLRPEPDLTDENSNININSRGNIYLTCDKWFFRSTDDDENWFGGSRPLIKYADINKETDDVYISDSIDGLIRITHILLDDYLTEHFNKPDLIFEIIRVTDKSELIGYSKVASEPKGLYLSVDDTTWNLIKNIDESKEINVIEPYKNLIIIGTTNGMEYSDNSGVSWYPIVLPNIPGNDKSITSISISDSEDIYAVYGNHYLIKGKMPYTSVIDNKEEKNDLQISPNPFYSSFKIEFTNSYSSAVNIDLYDILGNKIYTKNLGFLESGTHEANIEPDVKISSGLYIVAVRCGASVQYLKVLKGE